MLQNKKLIYFISWILTIIWLLNIFLADIIYNNLNIELYDPSNDINQVATPLTKTLEKKSIRLSQSDTAQNANSLADYNNQKEIDDKYNTFMMNLFKNNWRVDKCYELDTWIFIDKCIKQYKKKLLTNIKKVNLDRVTYNIILKDICSYWQNTPEDINKCINNNSIQVKSVNIFECATAYPDNRELKMECYKTNFKNIVMWKKYRVFMSRILDMNKGLIKIDSKWRVITKKVDSKLLKEHPEYWTMFSDLSPHFTNEDILDADFVKKDMDLYNFLKWEIKYYNNEDNFKIYKYSTYNSK